MAASRWTKWIVGLSGAALFTGFVGLNASHSPQSNAIAATSPSTSDSSGISDQWNNQDQASGGGNVFDSGSVSPDPGFQPDSGHGLQLGPSGGMRTHAS